MKIEKSRRVVESRPVCLDLKSEISSYESFDAYRWADHDTCETKSEISSYESLHAYRWSRFDSIGHVWLLAKLNLVRDVSRNRLTRL